MYHYKGGVTVGQVNRFIIEIDPVVLRSSTKHDHLSLKVKNSTSALMRPALLTGPYIFYISIREDSYRPDKVLSDAEFSPHFDANLKTNCSRWQDLPLLQGKDTEDSKRRKFVVDIVSQVIFSPTAKVSYEVTIGMDRADAKAASRAGKQIECNTPGLSVEMLDTSRLWNMPPIPRDKLGNHIPSDLPVEVTHKVDPNDGTSHEHLVVLTHGIHSNLTSDMLYVKEVIESKAEAQGQKVICKGFAGNACNTERGVKWLGKRLALWVLRETGWYLDGEEYKRRPNPYKAISFIAHSLGGLVQIFCVGYLYDQTLGKFFDSKLGLVPNNFITLATPWLGISAENPAFVKLALDFGLVGKTGQDLALSFKPLGEYKVRSPTALNKDASPTASSGLAATRVRNTTPLLRLMSLKDSPCHRAIASFEKRTVYANIQHDGIVPLRTSSLFFLDWEDFQMSNRSGIMSVPVSPIQENPPTITSQGSSDLRNRAFDSEQGTNYKADHEKDPESSDEESISSSHVLPTNPVPDGPTRVSDSVVASPNTTDILGQPETANPSTHKEVDSSTDNRQELLGSSTTGVGIQAAISQYLEGPVNKKFSTPENSEISADSIEGPSPDASVSSTVTSPTSPTDSTAQSPRASGPSDTIENASHVTGGLLSLLWPGQSTRKPSKAFTRSQIIASRTHEPEEHIALKEPSRTSFFKSLESVLNPPMPGLDSLRDPSLRDRPEDVIVHDKMYYPKDIPPLKELPQGKNGKLDQSRSARKGEEKERVRLEKIKLEEKIARGWHEDMSWRKILVKLQPDAHNNIVVRRMFANSYGWPVIDHLANEHFGPEDKPSEPVDQSQDMISKDWDGSIFLPDSPSEDDEEDKTNDVVEQHPQPVSDKDPAPA